MCEFKGNLVAWLDGELSPTEAAEVEQHVQSCADCSGQVSRYEQATRDFAAYHMAAEPQVTATTVNPRRLSRWVPAAIAIAAAILIAILIAPRYQRRPPASPQTAKTELPAAPVALEPAVTSPDSSGPAKHLQAAAKRHPAAHSEPARNEAAIVMSEPTVRIAIPADALYPPGAVPEGMAYFANVSFAADGSVQAFRLER